MRPLRPQSVDEVRDLVLRARRVGGRLRVHGSRHSVPASIYAGTYRVPRGQAAASSWRDAGPADDMALEVSLDALDDIVVRSTDGGKTALVSAGAGARLGLDPLAPAGRSRWENSLSYRLEQAGFALDGLGGISHQSIAGYLLTGSSGGSLRYSAADNVVGLELVDGLGRVHQLRRDAADPKNRDLFFAAGVSMGLLGVVTRVDLRVGARYDIVGQQRSTRRAESAVELQHSAADSERAIEAYLRRHDYGRILWWAQPGFDRVQVWAADRALGTPAAHVPFSILSPGASVSGAMLQTVIGHLKQLGAASRVLPRWAPYLEQVLAGTYRAVDRPNAPVQPSRRPGATLLAGAIRQLLELSLRLPASARLGAALDRLMPRVISHLMRLYVPDGVEPFADSWLYGLPMDNGLDDELWPAEFAEVWVPLHQAGAALDRLTALLAEGTAAERYALARTFPVEIYGGPESPFWLSPGYGRRSLRINPVWLAHWHGAARDYFTPFFDVLSDLDVRFHWGKHLPQPTEATRAHLRRTLPRLKDFLDLRCMLDPHGIFLTSYWREHLGVAGRALVRAPGTRK